MAALLIGLLRSMTIMNRGVGSVTDVSSACAGGEGAACSIHTEQMELP